MPFIPYRVDVPSNHHPWMNQLLAFSIFMAFFVQLLSADLSTDEAAYEHLFGFADMEAVWDYVLVDFDVRGLLGHMWLHLNVFHLGGNLLFLCLFGNAVCGRIGNVRYLFFYLALGLIAAVTHLFFDGAPTIGASGAISGVIGMFLVYFWRQRVHCILVVSMHYRSFRIPTFCVIGMWVLFDFIGIATMGEGVAYFAHLGGFFAGVIAAMVLRKVERQQSAKPEPVPAAAVCSGAAEVPENSAGTDHPNNP